MKNFILIGVVCLSVIIGGLFFSRLTSNRSKEETVEYTLNNKKVQLLVADTPEEHARGLMFRNELTDADGMIFFFDEKDYRTFWNKNTLMDLDVYWIDDKTVVGQSFLPSIKKSKTEVTITSSEPVNVVVEIPR